MPYARRTSSRPTRRSYRNRSTGATPKVSVTTKVPLAKKSAVMRNKRAIKSIRSALEGSIQKQLVNWTENDLRVSSTSPLLLAVDSFDIQRTTPYVAEGAPVYQENQLNQAIQEVSHYDVTTQAVNNPFLERWNEDGPNGGKMRVLSNRMTFLIEGKPALSNVRVNFTMFRCKVRNNIPSTVSTQETNFPAALKHMHHMADYAKITNQFPSLYFEKLYSRTVVMNSQTTSGAAGPQQLNRKYVRINYAPKGGRMIYQGITYPAGQDTAPTPISPEPRSGWWGADNRSQRSMTWLLISSDTAWVVPDPGQPDPNKCSISCSQLRTWRDVQGAYR